MNYPVYLYIAVMAIVTYLIRVLPLTLIKQEIKNPFIRSFLYYVPYVTLSVMTFPAIVYATATRYNIPVIELIINNHVLGMVRQWQTLYYGKRYSQTVLNDSVDYVKIAEAMGAKAYRVTQKEELVPVLKEAISLNIPVVIDCQIGCDDKVFPMVSPGAPIADAFDDTDLKIN